MDSPDDSRLRIGHAERDEVAERLRVAAGEGRLDLGELEERLESAYAARTRADLAPLTADLPDEPLGAGAHPGGPTTALTPVPRPAPPAPVEQHPGTEVLVKAVLGDTKRRGTWHVPPRLEARAVVGDVTLDLREAVLGPHTLIEASTVLGDVTVLVNAGTRVELRGRGILGDVKEARATVAAEVSVDSPLVEVVGRAVLGSVTVKRRGMPGELRRRLLGG